ncbi:MAG: ornithine carbamoyltransferase, partial [Pseudomonadota bacterium]|nr:ornithine carbamoyltransferase [Pseudomonadota bacterium]
MTRHFLDIDAFDAQDLRLLLDQAHAAKATWKDIHRTKPMSGKTVALIFEKPSTRTRVSFEVGIARMGGHPLVLSAGDLQLS